MNTRAYDNRRRQRRAAQVTETILDAAKEAFSTLPFDEVPLDSVARRAEVTVQTVLRRFGSKAGLFEAMARREGERILASRIPESGTGIHGAVDALVEHYERDGDFVHHLILQEHLTPEIASMVVGGRREHRAWAERLVALADIEPTGGELIPAVIAATDLSTWRLLRRDLGLDRAAAQRVVALLVTRLLDGEPGS